MPFFGDKFKFKKKNCFQSIFSLFDFCCRNFVFYKMKYLTFGFLLFVIFQAFLIMEAAGADCWWTGCQKNDWKVKGCGQYGRKTSGQKNCSGGKMYNCCK
uniref:Uncharacterized protein n=1 Tax=Cacopsylla melanoneura TaxID=428564 RepID=A0A8D8ZIB9_9HEMI